MAVLLRNWFQQAGGVDIEDEDILQTDFCGPMYDYDSAGRYLIESKKHMVVIRKLISPDFFDAGALTFAEPVGLPNMRNRRARANAPPVDYDV